MGLTTRWAAALLGGGLAVGAYRAVVSGAVTLDLGLGRRTRTLGPFHVEVPAPREVVFDVLSEPYLGRQSRAMAARIEVLERGTDMVLAAHRTPLGNGRSAVTVETVRFNRPERIDFRLVRGPVPYVVEEFLLTGDGDRCRLSYTGELGTDGWAAGALWGDLVAHRWEEAVADTFHVVGVEARRRAAHGRT
jgi:hypothetical protein